MPETQKQIMARLARLDIRHTSIHHAPTATVAESRRVKARMFGRQTKNLFLEDKAGALVLLTAWAETEVAMGRLHRRAGTKRLSFAPEDRLRRVLGVEPGHVTPLALFNDAAGEVRFLLDAALADSAHAPVSVHPLRNDMTVTLGCRDLVRFASLSGHAPVLVAPGDPDAAPPEPPWWREAGSGTV